MARRAAAAWLLASAVGLAPFVARSIDHSNLDEGRPLRFEDAYPIAQGEIAIEAGAGFVRERHGSDRGVLDLRLLYGALPNLHVELGTSLSTEPRSIDEPTRSGDLRLGALYNFNQETLWWPALAAAVEVDFPTGVDSAGVDAELKAIVTKSFGRTSLHLNASYERATGARGRERENLYEVVLGVGYPIGAPMSTRLVLLGDVFTGSSALRGDDNVAGVEVGLRYQLTQRWVLDAGVGSELTGPAERSPVYFRAGFSLGF